MFITLLKEFLLIVSILVIMDVTLEVQVIILTVEDGSVSILVIMDVTLEARNNLR